MDWTQLLSLAGYTTGICYFFYQLNKNTIQEWRAEHQRQMDKMDAKWEKLFELLLTQNKQQK